MQYRLNELALLALAGSALAHQPHQHKHAKLHERRLAAPYGMGNSTLPAGPTGGVAPPQDSTVTQLLTATVHATQLYTQAAPSAAANPIQAAEVDAESVDAATSPAAALTTDAETCDEVTVTVTNAPVTVTVTAAAGGVASSAASSYLAPSSFVLPGSSSTIEISTEATALAPTAASSSVYVAPSSAAVESAAAEAVSSSSAVYVAPSSSSIYVAPTTSKAASSAPATTVAPSSTVAASTSSTSSTSSAAASSSAATGVTGVTDKRGLVYNTFSGVVDQFTSSQISWGWNWAQTPGGSMPDGVEFVPILWGNRETDDLANWKSNAEEQISNGSKHLMGFNEPDVDSAGGGSDLAADVAASVYKEYLNDFASKATLVSPGVCNGEGLRESTGRNQGLDWLQDFHDACGGFTESGCKVDKINIHWYSSYQGDLDSIVSYFKEYVEKAYSKFNMNLWITEYQLQNADDATQEEFISKTSEWMSSQTYIERYSYFKAETIVGSSTLMSAYTS